MTRKLIVTALAVTALAAVAEMNLDMFLQQTAPEEQPAGKITVPDPEDGARPTTTTGTAEPDASVLRFFNGDLLHGRLKQFGAEAGLVWEHPDAEAPVTFAADNLQLLTFPPIAPLDQTVDAVVTLTNEDSIPGQLTELTEEHVILRTDYAGTLTIRRTMLQSITPTAEHGGIVYEGPKGLDDWVAAKSMPRRWEFDDGAFYANQSNCMIGRDVGLPDTARIDFDLGWRMYPSVSVAFYTDRLDRMGGNAYVLGIQAEHINLQRYTNNSSSALGNHHIPGLHRAKQNATVSIRVNREERTIALFVDGALCQQWTDAAGFAGEGTALAFYASNPMQRIRNIRVTEWDGSMEAGEPEPTDAGEADVIQFVNGDKVTGTLSLIADGTVTFVTDYAELRVPFARVNAIVLSSEGRQRARRQAADVRARLVGGGQITLAVDRIDDGTVHGSTENADGSLAVRLSAIHDLTFNLYDERHNEEEPEDSW